MSQELVCLRDISPLFGAIGGDLVGSVYEGRSKQIKRKDFPLLSYGCRLTDDSILTMATADCIVKGGYTESDFAFKYVEWAKEYPHRGYGHRFKDWVYNNQCHSSYNSFGNGSAMRVSAVGFVSGSIDDAEQGAFESASCTHSHSEGIKGAQAISVAVYMANAGFDKSEIKKTIEDRFKYNLTDKLNDIRISYRFDSSCQGSVPQAIISFLESESYEDAIRNAISLGGDSDTLAAMAGGIALAYYKTMPQKLHDEIVSKMDERMLDLNERFREFCRKYKVWTIGCVDKRAEDWGW